MQEWRHFVRLTHAEFYAALFADDTERAVRAIEEQMALAEVWWEVPLTVFPTLRGVGRNAAAAELAMLLGHKRLNEGQFQRLDQRLAAREANLRLRESVLGGRAEPMTTLQYTGENMRVFRAEDGEFHPEPLVPALTMEQQAFRPRHSRQVADAIDATGPEGHQRMMELIGEHKAMPQSYSAPRWMCGTFEGHRSWGLEYRRLPYNARPGMRVDRYYRQHARPPDKLDDVLDGELRKVPTCLVSHLSLIYEPEAAGGFVIYAPGDNGMDEGGGERPDQQEGKSAFRVRYEQGDD